MVETAEHFKRCLICDEIVMTPKGVNAKQHFHRHSSHRYGNLQGESRKICVENLKRKLRKQISAMNAFLKTTNKRIEASYMVAYRLGRRQYNITDQLKHSLQKMVKNEGSLFSLAVDELTDITDSAQLLIFVRSLSSSFELCEGLRSMETLTTSTHGKDIFLAVKRACIKFGVDLKNLRGICTDGKPAMHGNKQLINLHYIIHHETLCSKFADLDNILKDVNHIILFVRANAPHHRQFLEILRAKESSVRTFVTTLDIRSLSQGEISHRALLLRKEIVEFYFSKNNDCSLQNSSFLISLAFLVDLLSHVNHLHHHHVNQALQGRTASQLKALIDSKEIRPDDIPTNSFSGDFEKISVALQLVVFSHLVATESAPLDLQMELVYLKNNEPQIKKFEEKYDIVETWKVAVDYLKLPDVARNILVHSGSTCICKAAFSRMKYLKHKYRTRLANDNLVGGIRLMASNEKSDFARLVEMVPDKRCLLKAELDMNGQCG
ncbi:General transcription factor II-I repeat domain-containing protein 2 [Trichinella papuae]|uniref:General transcription factor II-I repeat domain-containing protein 2 n=1 Tax=Trichinella papuae TaxID=268474 RepID=A0A0V1N7X7_9BILA|nr:General transcription factor II-I repeat domain-containing protein 2 [Trichinella papuae]